MLSKDPLYIITWHFRVLITSCNIARLLGMIPTKVSNGSHHDFGHGLVKLSGILLDNLLSVVLLLFAFFL